MLEPDQNQIEQFVDALFRHAGAEGFVSLRAFYEGTDNSFRITPIPRQGNFQFLVDAVVDDARRAAQAPRAAVFCPPIAVFNNRDRAREEDLLQGPALSVECDQRPRQARAALEQLLGPVTVVVKSGGVWRNGDAEEEDKLHLHWRLKHPAEKDDLTKLKEARRLAALIVGGDPTTAPINHPLRWPGSWHRKGEPRLCQIDAVNPDVEIDLNIALAKLQAAAPEQPKTAPGNGAAGNSQDWDALVADVISGSSFHRPLVALAARLVGSGTHDGTTVKLLRAIMQASVADHDPLRWQVRYDGIPRIVSSARDKFARDRQGTAGPAKPLLWPYEARDFLLIPRRRWLHAGHYVRAQVVMTAAPGGFGKTSLVLTNSLEMATGRGLIGPAPPGGPLHVAYWNAEDPDDEIERRIAAACLQHDIDPAALHGQLFLGSRLTGHRRIASLDRNNNVVFDTDLLKEIERLIGELGIACAIFDPLVAFHRVPEGDNMAMEQVIKDGFGEIATRTDCCIELSQHTRKASQMRQGELTADDARGAGAMINAARSVRILNRMTAEEAELPKIEPEERRHYLRVSRDKTNLAPPGKATWVHLVSVELPNGDHVQAVEAWNYPEAFDVVTAEDVHWIREEVRRKEYRYDFRSSEWVGYPVAERFKLNPGGPGDRKRLNAILRGWFATGVLAVETHRDDRRRDKQFVVPGEWNNAS